MVVSESQRRCHRPNELTSEIVRIRELEEVIKCEGSSLIHLLKVAVPLREGVGFRNSALERTATDLAKDTVIGNPDLNAL